MPMSQDIRKWYDFALAQMAAERYLDGILGWHIRGQTQLTRIFRTVS
jgi:hypothetical protein